MNKFILAGNHGTCEGDSYDFVVPFEYEGTKEDFVLNVLEGNINMSNALGMYYSDGEIDNIEREVYTLDEWFNRNKTTIK